MAKATTPGRGRPPAGPRGELTSEYPMLTVRLPPGTKAMLKALALQREAPLWKVVDDIVAAYVQALPAGDRRLLTQLAARVERGGGGGSF